VDAPGGVTGSFVAVRVPDWAVAVAMSTAGTGPERPAAVHDGRQVVAVSAVARARGVRPGMRRRGAQEACPELELLGADPEVEARAFDDVAAAVEREVARVTVVRPGLLWGPVPRHVGEDGTRVEALAASLTDAVAVGTGHECLVGVAGTPFAAVVATGRGEIVPPVRTQEYLRTRPVAALRQMVGVPRSPGAGRRDPLVDDEQVGRLVDLLARLGVRTLGDLLDLGARALHSRFGGIGLWAHRLSSGDQDRAVEVWEPEEPLMVGVPIDPPALRSDAVTFLARPVAETLRRMLQERSLTCARLRITAVTDEGGRLTRLWQADDTAWGATTVRHVVDRVRWQLDGWLARGAGTSSGASSSAAGPVEDPPVAPVVRLEIAAEEVSPAPLQQETLWGGGRGGDRRARRVIDRVQGLLGVGEVFAAVPQGGRTPGEQVRLVPWGQPADHVQPLARPWPGSLPAPSPATVLTEPAQAEVLDDAGLPVRVGERLGLSGEPRRVRLGAEQHVVTGWAGPWPVVERWWTSEGRRVAYVQVVTATGTGLLLGYQQGAWSCEAVYD